MLQLREVRLRVSQPRRGVGLRQPAPRNQFVYLHRELHAQLAFASVRKAKVNEDITASNFNHFTFSCHNVPRSPTEPPSVGGGSSPHRSERSGVLTVISSGNS